MKYKKDTKITENMAKLFKIYVKIVQHVEKFTKKNKMS